jgi:Na+/proline symporter
MFGLSFIDILVITVYFTVIIGIGVRSRRKIKSREDYLLAGRKFGKLIQTFASFGQATSADGPVGVATTTFKNGASGIWSALLMVFATPVFWITSPWLRRMRVTTMGDFYTERFGSRKMAATYALVASIGMMGLLSVGYTAMNKTIMAITPKPASELTIDERNELSLANELGKLESRDFNKLDEPEKLRLKELRSIQPQSVFSYFSENMIIWAVCLIIIIYAVLGGLEAAFYTDMLQGFFIILLSIVLLPFSWWKIKKIHGGPGNENALAILHQKLPDSFFEIFGSPTLIDFTWYYILAASLVASITVVTQPNQLVTNAAAKDEYSARFGFVTGVFIKRFCTILWGMIGISAVLLYTGTVHDSDLVWGHATLDLLGPLNIGLVGLMVASMMAALMSTADTLMLSVSGLVLHNVYQPLFPGKSEKHYIRTGRIAGVLFLAGGALITTQFDNILEILKFVWEFFVIFAAAFWLGLKWRRANRQGAWSSILVSLALFYLLPVLIPSLYPSLKQNPRLLLQTQPDPIIRTYTVREADITERKAQIEMWDIQDSLNNAYGERPDMLIRGEKFTKSYELPSKTIFWSKEPEYFENAQTKARGYFFPELILWHTLGGQLHLKPYALIETVRLLIRLAVPFLILIVVSLATRPAKSKATDCFFIKMRTKVRGMGNENDQKDLNYAKENPKLTESLLLFPNSSWEIYKWDRQDISGFLISIGIVFLVLLALFLSVKAYG